MRSPAAETSTSWASSASSTGMLSPIGLAVPRLPPRVAALRMSREANCGTSDGQQRHAPVEPTLDLGQAQRGADLEGVVGLHQGAQLGQPVDGDGQSGPVVAQVQLDTPVGGAGQQLGLRPFREQRERLVEADPVGRTTPCRLVVRVLRGVGAAVRVRTRNVSSAAGLVQGVRRVADRAVAGAAAQVAAQRVQVEAVRRRARASVLAGAPPGGGRGGRTRRPSRRRSPACSSRTGSHRGRPSRAARGAGRRAGPGPRR